MLQESVPSVKHSVLVLAQGSVNAELDYTSHDLRRWGAQSVTVGPPSLSDPPVNPSGISDAVLMAWWWIARARLDVNVRTLAIGPDDDESGSFAHSVQRAIDDHDGVVVVMADGPAALAPKAPIPIVESAVRLDHHLAAFVDGKEELPFIREDSASSIGWYSQSLWRILSANVSGRAPRSSCHCAPFGVGYHAARWTLPAMHGDQDHMAAASAETFGVAASPRPIIIVGPTGTGKSDLALDLAEILDGQIVNLDAMQLYKGMDIGTAKLAMSERRGVPHHMLDVLDITETASVADYQRDARNIVEYLRSEGHTPIVVGGSMMYYQSLIDEWNFPETDPVVRARYEARLGEIGVEALHEELAAKDPEAAKTILKTDPRRTVRALEVIELTGKPFAASRPTIGAPRWDAHIIALDMQTDELDSRLEQRTRKMFENGLVDEVIDLERKGLRDGVTARRAIGYSQVLEMLDYLGENETPSRSVEDAQYRTYVGTRRYVRRQRSWFRRDPRIHWLNANAESTEPLADQALRTVRKRS